MHKRDFRKFGSVTSYIMILIHNTLCTVGPWIQFILFYNS